MCQCCAEKKDIYLPQLATVADISQMNVTEKYLRLAMEDGQFDFIPGQFVEVSIAGFGEAPITISSSPTLADCFELVVRKVGRVSGAIHNLKKGDKLGIRGPLGRGIYPVEEAKGKNLVFICGGIGLVPQRSFINYVLDNRGDYGEVAILQGPSPTICGCSPRRSRPGASAATCRCWRRSTRATPGGRATSAL